MQVVEDVCRVENPNEDIVIVILNIMRNLIKKCENTFVFNIYERMYNVRIIYYEKLLSFF